MASVRLTDVSKRYENALAVDRLDLEVADGELLVILGPSGSGKTTVLRLIAGLETASEGEIRIGERDVARLPPGKRNVSMVFQNHALFPHLDVADNIGFGLVARHVRPQEVRQRVAEAAALVGCGDVLERHPDQLSGGERQRVALARALVRDPDAYLLDEPLSNLDAQLRVQMRAELRALHRRVSATMLYVTHDQHEGLLLGDRVAVLRGGVLQQIGTPDEVYARPANRFVASFVGSPPMNILPADVVDGRLRAGPFSRDVSRSAATLPQRVEVGVRPEHIRLTGAEDGVRAEVELVERAGSETYLHLAAGGHRLVVRTRPEERPPASGHVWIDADLEAGWLFDAESGTSIRTLA